MTGETTPTKAAAEAEIVSEETSTRICSHMNEDHSVSVHGMAKSVVSLSGGWHLTRATLKKVTADGCHIQVIMCCKDMCKSEKLVYPIDPPVTSSAELRPRLIAIHQKVCMPQINWLLQKPVAFMVIVIFAFSTYATVILKVDNLVRFINDGEGSMIQQFISLIFGSAERFGMLVTASFWFCVLVHVIEAAYSVKCSNQSLYLPASTTVAWAFLVFLVGFPVLEELLDLMRFVKVKPEKKV